MMIPDQKLLFEIIKWLGSIENENIKKALTADAALIMKEIIEQAWKGIGREVNRIN